MIPSRLRPAALLALACALLAGCETAPDRRSAAEDVRRAAPSLAAHDSFFGGRIAAQLTLASVPVSPRGPGHVPPGGWNAGAGLVGGDGMEGRREGGDPDRSEELRPRYANSPMPPALFRLRLENTSREELTVEIQDLNSELGNFATRPDKFTLAPGASGTPNAMQSLLGLDTVALPVTLSLRVGGQNETKVLTLRPVPTESAGSPPAP